MARSKTAPVPQTEEATVQEAITAGSAAQRSLAQLLAMPITTANLPMVGSILQDVVTKRKELDARLKSITAPMRAAEKSVRDLFKPALNALAEAEAFLKQGIGNAQREQYAANAAAMQQAQVALQHGDVRAAALAAHAIAPISAPTGIGVRDVVQFTVVDAAAVPRELCTPDDAKIRVYLASLRLTAATIDTVSIPGVTLSMGSSVSVRT